MTETQLQEYLLKRFGDTENETLEWKDFTSLKHYCAYEKNDIISYISAFANNKGGVLIIGVEDKTCEIIGIKDFNNNSSENICQRISDKIANPPKIELETFETENGNIVWAFTIGKCPFRKPTIAHRKAFYRQGDNLVDIPQWREQEIVNQELENKFDWSGQICENATLDDLDPNTIELLKKDIQQYKPTAWDSKYSNKSNLELLTRLGLVKNKKITNACVLMFGQNEIFENDERFTGFARIQWQYYPDKDVTKYGKTREQFFIPFYPGIKEIWTKIDSKNDTLANQNLYQSEAKQYEEITIRELLLNSIAHREYANFGMRPFIEIIQTREGITFKNSGKPPFDSIYELEERKVKYYRNRILADFLNKVGLVDQEGFGLLDKVVEVQAKKGLNIPILNTQNNETWVTINTIVKNIEFTKKLFERTDLNLKDIILLDNIIQGKNSIPEDISAVEANSLKDKKIIEITGTRYRKCKISDNIANVTDYKGRKQVKEKFTFTQEENEVLNFIKKHGKGRKRDFMQLFEYKNYSYDMVYNILRRLKSQNIITKNSKHEWYLSSVDC